MATALVAADKPSREVQELQRDVAQLQEIVKTLQRTFEDRVGTLGTQVQGAADAAAKAGAATAAVQRSVDQLSRDLDHKLAPIGAIGGRVDQLAGSVGTMQQAMSDLTSVVNRLLTQVGDLTMAVKASKEPVAPPGPPMTANDMWVNAERDQLSGKYEIALQEYDEYLKWYGNSPQADLAWYAIGSIQLTTKNYDKALDAFNTILEKYPASTKTPEALFYKSKALEGLNRTKEAIDARLDLRRRFPKNPLATQR